MTGSFESVLEEEAKWERRLLQTQKKAERVVETGRKQGQKRFHELIEQAKLQAKKDFQQTVKNTEEEVQKIREQGEKECAAIHLVKEDIKEIADILEKEVLKAVAKK